MFGGGTMSSSDGQRFPVRGKSTTTREMTVHGGRVRSTYTHVSDQWSTYGTKQIVPTHREAHYALDEFLGNATDLPITEHATNTHGVTLINFALFDLVGKALTPRIRDLGKVTLVRADTPTATRERYPYAGALPSGRWNEDLLASCWAHGWLVEVRAGHRLPGGGQVVGRIEAEHPGRGAQGGRYGAPSTPRNICQIPPTGGRSPGS
ncbi:Tn3 family transposase [Nonomuraea sp. NPDC050394]|uniref:Tn3 family transposase n=1 Tax=Nonomuraea sp. NPDC050394 TaxID=3364363 RepID=UPI0037949992